MSYIEIGEYRFKGVARDGEAMTQKIEKIVCLWEMEIYTPRAVSKKVKLDTRTTRDILEALHLL